MQVSSSDAPNAFEPSEELPPNLLPREPSALKELRGVLSKTMPRIINLLYDWDPNCNGNITRAEFHRALTHLNFDASGATINALFSLSDSNGDDVVSFRELQQVIYNSPPTVQDKILFDGAALATTHSTAPVSTSADISTFSCCSSDRAGRDTVLTGAADGQGARPCYVPASAHGRRRSASPQDALLD